MFMHQSILPVLADIWMPRAASTAAQPIDWLFYFILYICIFFFFLILGLLVAFSWMYRYQPGKTQGPAPKHSTALELTWTFIPTVIVIVIFYYGFKGYIDLAVPPPNAYEVIVLAQTWGYQFQYPDGAIDDVLHIPAGRPVELILNSKDVIHGFYVPEFRLKKDIVPGRFNRLWFQANEPTEPNKPYDVYCTQYCGQGHSTMRSTVTVDSRIDFDKYIYKISHFVGPPPAQGRHIYEKHQCIGCHSVDGTRMTGPTWKNMWGNPVDFESGPSLVVDAAYIRESILQPSAKIVKTFSNVMPPQSLKDEEINEVIAYIQTLSDNYKPPATTQPTSGPATAPTTAPSAPLTASASPAPASDSTK
jgi:cytochrome c oxidase subunit 2